MKTAPIPLSRCGSATVAATELSTWRPAAAAAGGSGASLLSWLLLQAVRTPAPPPPLAGHERAEACEPCAVCAVPTCPVCEAPLGAIGAVRAALEWLARLDDASLWGVCLAAGGWLVRSLTSRPVAGAPRRVLERLRGYATP